MTQAILALSFSARRVFRIFGGSCRRCPLAVDNVLVIVETLLALLRCGSGASDMAVIATLEV